MIKINVKKNKKKNADFGQNEHRKRGTSDFVTDF